MARALLTTSAYERDLRRVGRRGKDLDKLEVIVDLLQGGGPCRRGAASIPCAVNGKATGTAMWNLTGCCSTSFNPAS
jgi:hypothetical protein